MLIAAALLSSMLVSTQWVDQHRNEPLNVIVEVGIRTDYDSGHIPGARFIAREEIVADCDGLPNELTSTDTLVKAFERAGVGDSKLIVIYSREPLLATRTWFTLDYLSHGSRAAILDGGWQKWALEKREVSTVTPYVKAAPFTIADRPYSVAKFTEVSDLVRRRGTLPDKLLLIDARPSLFFSGEMRGAGIRRAGHIPDAVNIPWTSNLTGDNAPVFRSESELLQLYKAAGVTREAIVIAYCRTGMEASMTYFVLRYLGYDVSLYDGSFIEWSAAKGTAVASTPGP
jgi:thiosulfate/3-mercaptopyruvate sulfurtransferase